MCSQNITNKMQRFRLVWQIPDAVCAVLNSWWWTEKPSETCRAYYRNREIMKLCILLVILCEYYRRNLNGFICLRIGFRSCETNFGFRKWLIFLKLRYQLLRLQATQHDLTLNKPVKLFPYISRLIKTSRWSKLIVTVCQTIRRLAM